MYSHALAGPSYHCSRVAVSPDGIRFTASEDLIGRSYMRGFRHDGWWSALAMPGILCRSRDGLTDFEEGPTLFKPDMRHAVRVLAAGRRRARAHPRQHRRRGRRLARENATQRAQADRPWEGAGQRLEPSIRDAVNNRVNQIRAPAIYVEDNRIYLLYSVAGEAGIGLARLDIHC